MTQIPVEYLFSTKNITCIGEHGNTYRYDACRDSFSFGFQNQKFMTFSFSPIMLHARIQNSVLTSSNSSIHLLF